MPRTDLSQYWPRCTFICIPMFTQIPVAIGRHNVLITSRPKITVPINGPVTKRLIFQNTCFLWHNSASRKKINTKYRSYIHISLRVSSLCDWLWLPVWLRWFNCMWLIACTNSGRRQLQIVNKMMSLHMHMGWAKCVKFADMNYMLTCRGYKKSIWWGG